MRLRMDPEVGGSRIWDPGFGHTWIWDLKLGGLGSGTQSWRYRIWEPARNSGMEAVTGAQCWDGCTCEEKMMMYMRRAHNGGLMHFRRACSAVGTRATHPQNVHSNANSMESRAY